jgi:DNA polymerase-3 subunit gamma/tau
MRYQVLARKYRPKQFNEIVGQAPVVQALTNALTRGSLHHAYLFTGTRGSGKTTLARLLAKCLSCETGITAQPCDQCSHCQAIDQGRFPDFFEIDAASRTKVEDTREILDNVLYAPAQGRFKIYLIDEVHMLSGHSFNALLKTLEEPPEHVKFLLATTDYQKLPATVLSRCLQFHLHPINPNTIKNHLADVLTQEQRKFEEPALARLAEAARGSLRDALSLLDQAMAYSQTNTDISDADVKTMLGSIDSLELLNLLNALVNRNASELMQAIRSLENIGAPLSTALNAFICLLHQLTRIQLVPESATLNSQDTPQHSFRDLAKRIHPEDIQVFYQMALNGQRDFALAPSPSIAFEMIFLRMLAFYPENSAKTTNTKLNTTLNTTLSTTRTISTPSSDWPTVISQLTLSGAASALIQNSSLESWETDTVKLLIKPSQKALAQASQIQRIEKALSDYLQRPTRVQIRVATHDLPTPAALDKQQQEERQASAKQTLIKDETLQQLMRTFDATLVENSIRTDKSTKN